LPYLPQKAQKSLKIGFDNVEDRDLFTIAVGHSGFNRLANEVESALAGKD
jgi:hypothetical protein